MKRFDNILQTSAEWFQLRKGSTTGTTLKDLMGTPAAREAAIRDLMAECLTIGVDAEMDYENPMDRGTRLQPEAIKLL